MANFELAYSHTMVIEGGYVNNPTDKGGETYKGVARKKNPSWKGWAIIDAIKTKVGTSASAINLAAAVDLELQSQIKYFYKVNYWDVNRLDEVRYQSIGDEMFDTGVNMGVGSASRFLQESLNLCNRNGKSYSDIAVDGKIGPVTLEMLNNRADEKAVFNTLNMLQGEKYLDIMRGNKTQEIFWAGWLKRIILK